MNIRTRSIQRLLGFSAVGVIMSAASLVEAQSQQPSQPQSQQQSQQQPQQQLPQFSELDANSDKRLTEQELSQVAQRQNTEAKKLIDQHDNDDSNALEQSEYRELRSTIAAQPQSQSNQVSQRDSEQQSENQRTKIVVEEKPTKVVVDKPAPQVTVEQATPKVTVTTKDPDVKVEQGDPKVSVQQPDPRVSVNQQEPEVAVRESEPEVEVNRSQPDVNVQRAEPEVNIASREGQQSEQQTQQAGEEQSTQEQQRQASQSTRQGSGQGTIDEIYTTSINELADAEVVNSSGEVLGNVEAVIIKQDRTEAGFIIAPSDAADANEEYVYAPAEELRVEQDQLVVQQEGASSGFSQSQDFDEQDYQLVPETEQSLSQFLDMRRVTQR